MSGGKITGDPRVPIIMRALLGCKKGVGGGELRPWFDEHEARSLAYCIVSHLQGADGQETA